MEHEWFSKREEITGDILSIVVGLCILGTLLIHHFIPDITSLSVIILGVLLIVAGIIGLILDFQIVAKQRRKPPWLPNLLAVLGVILMSSGTFYALLNPSVNAPSVIYVITSTCIGSVFLIFSFGYGLWWKYKIYLN